MDQNNGESCLHGGKEGWADQLWETEVEGKENEVMVTFSYESEHLEMGFPGRVQARCIYKVTKENKVGVSYEADIQGE